MGIGIGGRHETGSGSESASRFSESLKIYGIMYIIHKFIQVTVILNVTPKLQLKRSGIRFVECIEFFFHIVAKKFFQKFPRIDICDEFLYGKTKISKKKSFNFFPFFSIFFRIIFYRKFFWKNFRKFFRKFFSGSSLLVRLILSPG